MALDPSIILNIGRGVTPLKSQSEIQDEQMQREVNSLKLNQLRQGIQDEQATRDIARNTAPDGLADAFYKGGYVKQGQEAQKFQTEQQKAQREAMKAKVEQQLQQFQVAGQIMNGVVDQATWDRARQQTAQVFGPEAAAQLPEQYDPALIEQKRAQAMTVKDQLEQKYKAMQFTTPTANARLQAQTSSANNAATIANSRENAQMTDARSREANRLRAEANRSGRVPSGYREAADGSLEFIPGGPADPASKAGGGKPLTEGQSKALLFGTRMKEANEILEDLAAGPDGVDRPSVLKRAADAVPGLIGGGALRTGANALQSEKQQQVEQAQRDFLNAVLRRESGAVIGESEFESGKKQYFPAIGDEPAVIAQKKRNREVAMRGILEEVPEGEARVAKVRGPKANAGPIKITNADEYAKVPSGAEYISPDGKKRRKP
jgi:hypothetical protein